MVVRALRSVIDDLFGDHRALVRGDGWAMTSVLRSIRRVALLVAAGWQLVMLLASVATLGPAAWPLVLAQLVLAATALIALKRRIPAFLIPLGMMGIGLWSYLASGDLDSALVFAACWEIDFASCLMGLLVLHRISIALVVVPAVATTATVLLALPAWGAQLPVAIIVTQSSIILAMRAGLPWLLRLAAETDAVTARAETASLRIETIRRTSARLAEESRTLHDTAINTLGAVANGGAGVADPERVRAQCARDIDLLRALRGERAPSGPVRLRMLFDHVALPVHRAGLDDEDLERIEGRLGPERVRAVVACAREAATNAAKHSGADRVEILLAEDAGQLRVVVRDSGRGFDGAVPEGRGIASSILARADAAGFSAAVTSRPGAGTAVELRVPIRSAAAGQGPELERGIGAPAWSGNDVDASVSALHGRAGDLWALGVTAISVVLTLGGGTNRFLALFPMLGVMLLAWAVSRSAVLRRAPAVLSAILIACTCAVFFLSAAATAFGSAGAVNWQALAPTGAFVLLLSLDAGRTARFLGAAAWILLACGTAVIAWRISPTAAQITVIAALVGLGFVVVWETFRARVGRLAEQAERARQRVLEAELRAELDAAAQADHRRWTDAGLDASVELLRAIAAGEREPSDPALRLACAAEERYLRQLVQLSPELVHLSRSLVSAIRLARERAVDFSLRIGATDTGDEEAARDIAGTVLGGLRTAPRGSALSASLFPVGAALQLTLIGPGIAPQRPLGPGERHERVGDLELLELSYARDTVAAGRTEES
ncbi:MULTISPECIES: sensor histidine kinase [unclassified Leucobacter]|uniref:sensor histidine kinase n=1 Tax=unclassified Leucobacter TaxID=2621730 RepID=UPI000622207B|nr:sensor histidine kinase [Leucobacter sp. Ag1]KKI16928.1 hypothetical protein XM48_13085 [Leucobacter sp. Ag1]